MAILTGIDVVWTTTPYTVTIARSTGNALIQVEGPGVDASPNYVYSINLTDLHQTLRDFEDSEEGIVKPDIHEWTDPKTVGGVTLAPVIEITDFYRVEFEDGQYAVILDGANQNIADRIVANQVSIRSKNSAGLQNLDALLASAYAGKIHVHTVKGQAGQSIPLGTRDTPVNNFEDAHAIADQLGIKTFVVMNSTTLTTGVYTDGYTFLGDNPVNTILTLVSEPNVVNCEFQNLTVTGIFDGNNVIRECNVNNISYANGFIFRCSITGTISIGNGQLTMLDCYSGTAGGDPGQVVYLDMGGLNNSLAVRNFSGGFHVMNYAGGTGAVSIDMASGRVILDSDVTGGSIFIRGVADVYDNSTGTAVINDMTVNTAIKNIATPTATISYKDMILIGELSK